MGFACRHWSRRDYKDDPSGRSSRSSAISLAGSGTKPDKRENKSSLKPFYSQDGFSVAITMKDFIFLFQHLKLHLPLTSSYCGFHPSRMGSVDRLNSFVCAYQWTISHKEENELDIKNESRIFNCHKPLSNLSSDEEKRHFVVRWSSAKRCIVCGRNNFNYLLGFSPQLHLGRHFLLLWI